MRRNTRHSERERMEKGMVRIWICYGLFLCVVRTHRDSHRREDGNCCMRALRCRAETRTDEWRSLGRGARRDVRERGDPECGTCIGARDERCSDRARGKRPRGSCEDCLVLASRGAGGYVTLTNGGSFSGFE